jgi:hypothetical protein
LEINISISMFRLRDTPLLHAPQADRGGRRRSRFRHDEPCRIVYFFVPQAAEASFPKPGAAVATA